MSLWMPIMAATALQALPAPAAAGWEEIANEADGRTSIDPASIARDGDVVRFVVRTEAAGSTAGNLRVLVMRMQLQCRSRQIGIEAGDAYGADGRMVNSVRVQAGEIAFERFGESDAHAAMYRRVCGTQPD